MSRAIDLQRALPAPSRSQHVVVDDDVVNTGHRVVEDAAHATGVHSATSTHMVAHAGANRNRIVHAQFGDLVERRDDKHAAEEITKDEEDATTDRTAAALAKLVGASVAASRAVQLPSQSEDRHKTSEFIHYQADEDAPGYNPAASQRVIRMVEAPVDPLEPPKFKHKKIPRGQGSPPAPVMHAPAKKLTAADQQAWDIPPVVSNYKNPKGFVVSLDKRAAMDGRALVQVEASDRFAAMAETLHLTRQAQARQLELRAAMRRRDREQARKDEDSRIRELAAQQRAERAGLLQGDNGAADIDGLPSLPAAEHGHVHGHGQGQGQAETAGANAGDDEMTGAELAREAMREVRKRMREAEAGAGAGAGAGSRAGKRPRVGAGGGRAEEERDVSERIALGLSAGGASSAAARGGEAMFDSRLFERGAADGGLGSGFGASDDVYNVYSEPLRAGAAPQGQYRPRGLGAGGGSAEDAAQAINASATSKFGSAAEGEGGNTADFEGVAHPPTRRAPGPVVLEKADAPEQNGALDAALGQSTEADGGGGRAGTFSHIGKAGFMRAAAGSATLGGGGGGRRKGSIEFE